MRIIVLGGAGDIGSRAVEELATTEGLQGLTIADLDTERAQALADRLENSVVKLEVATVDATDHDALVETIRGHDVAASALGPFYRFEVPLAEAAIEAGADYCSVCDEFDATEAVFDRCDESAKENGRIVLTGLGASPGVTNVCVRYLADALDSVKRADVHVYLPLTAGGGEAVIRHLFHVISGKVGSWRGGERVDLRACSEAVKVAFPQFGTIKLWNMGHAEPITVPRFIDGIEEVNFYMGFGRGSGLFVLPARMRFFDWPFLVRVSVPATLALERLTQPDEPGVGAVRVDVWGEKDGAESHQMLCGVGQMREVTGICLAVGAVMLTKKEVTVGSGGVFAPEACLEPRKVLEAMRQKGVVAFHDLEMTRPATPDSPL